MQELAFLLTGLAGAASAVAFAKFPKNTDSLKIIGPQSPRIKMRDCIHGSRTRHTCENCLNELYQLRFHSGLEKWQATFKMTVCEKHAPSALVLNIVLS